VSESEPLRRTVRRRRRNKQRPTTGAPSTGSVTDSPTSDGPLERDRSPSSTPAVSDDPAMSPTKSIPGSLPSSRRGSGPRDNDRAWRDLVGSSPSQIGVSGSMRARDVARPTEQDLAAAESELAIVRRQWHPPEQDR